jgi:hypothetical protein
MSPVPTGPMKDRKPMRRQTEAGRGRRDRAGAHDAAYRLYAVPPGLARVRKPMSTPQQEAMDDPRCTRADPWSCRTVRASPSDSAGLSTR